MRMRKGIFLVAFLICSLQLIAQERLSRRQQADEFFDRYEYSESLKLYLPLVKKQGNDLTLIERIADCYRMTNNYGEAEKWYSQAVKYPKAPVSNTLFYAEALLNNQRLQEAREQFKKYYSASRDTATLTRQLNSIDSASAWIKNKSPYFVQNVKALNSPYSDWGLSYYGKSALAFVSDRDQEKGTYKWTGNGWLKPYMASLQNKLIGELPLRPGSDMHIGPVAFNAAEDTAYITITTDVSEKALPVENVRGQRLYTRRLEIIVATKSGGQWRNYSKFPYSNVKEYSVGHAALSPNGSLLYFTSDMPGGEGKNDIWYCEHKADGWSKPVNCGKTINSSEEEAFPTIGFNGDLYFSSKASGMGGYDVFSAKGEKSIFETPQNLKHPINSTADDFCLVSRDGLSGYLSSNRAGGLGNDDIYSFGHVKPLPRVNVLNQVPQGGLPADGKLKPGTSYVLRNIYYDLDKSDIRPDAAKELDYLFQLLVSNPEIKIELSSHTDSRASDEYNLLLSQHRAEAAVEYLWKKGIAKERLFPKGYGEARLLNRCSNGVSCSEGEHQANRRTEIKVLD